LNNTPLLADLKQTVTAVTICLIIVGIAIVLIFYKCWKKHREQTADANDKLEWDGRAGARV
jgi:heme/copper-type cytochrome/quinol oxidase subunit 2